MYNFMYFNYFNLAKPVFLVIGEINYKYTGKQPIIDADQLSPRIVFSVNLFKFHNI